ncbi:MAG TPA: LysR family transcriptional regulator [Burkholderiales bacterium]|jgi:DNA-binding transcriptional LysR family regulator|nr:LysR family transcriptional regulator [Burkholderiales bacterium]
MDFRRLRYFIAVAEELSFSAAARRLHVSQPPLSMQIRAMEEELDVTLFDRTKRRIALTESGRVFLAEARAALDRLERAKGLARLAKQGEVGTLRLAFTGSVPMADPFPRLVHAFRTRCPAASIHFAHRSTGQQLQSLAALDIDVGFMRPSPLFEPPSNLVVHDLWHDRLKIVVPKEHRLARKRRAVSMEALSEESFILFPRRLACGLHDYVMALCNGAGFVPRVVQEAGEGATILGLVAAGVGVSVLPESYAKVCIPGVVYMNIASKNASSRLILAYRHSANSALLGRFVEMALKAAQRNCSV